MFWKAGDILNIYEVVFKDKGKGYYFNGENLKIPNRVTVVVETEKGLQFGRVVRKVSSKEVSDIDELKKVIRISTKKDYEQYLKNLKDADEALRIAKKENERLGLGMNFLEASFTFDRKQLLFNFYADQRVDFRELAKILAGIYKTRIELRQIGARDKASEIGGIGVCGRKLCCASCLKKPESITMQMAKNQNLALNPSKINGACGRLLCCLAYEDEAYICCSDGMPNVGDKIDTDKGNGNVVSIDILNRSYKVLVDNQLEEVHLDHEQIS